MQSDKIYFLDSLYGIKYFLTLYNPDEKNIIITTEESTELKDFIEYILPNQPIIKVPEIKISFDPQENSFDHQINQLSAFKKQFTNCFYDLPSSAKVIFFTWTNTLHFYVLLSDLKHKKIDIQFVNIHDEKILNPLEKNDQTPAIQNHIKRLSDIIDLNLIPYLDDKALVLGLEDYNHQIDIHADPWQTIGQKYTIENKNINKNNALFIDAPIFNNEPKGVNAEITQKLLINFLEKQINKGKQFHLKPHDNEKYQKSSLDGTLLKDKIMCLPKHIPLELLLDQYDEVYSINWFSFDNEFKCRIYSLVQLLVFNTIEFEQQFWNTIKADYHEYKNNILHDNCFDVTQHATPINNEQYIQHSISTNESGEALVSIIIPTMNRSDFVNRMLNYYHTVGFKGFIFIGDSSNEDHTYKNKNVIRKYSQTLNIIYNHLPKKDNTIMAVCKKLVQLAPTPYVAFSGDDDFLIAQSLGKCADFLKNNSEYVAAHGLRINMRLKDTGAYNKVHNTEYVRQIPWNSDQSTERWSVYMRNAIANMYSVFDKRITTKMYPNVDSFNNIYIASELLPSSFIPISGKTKQLDCLSIVFQVQGFQEKEFSWDRENLFSLSIQPEWYQSVITFKNAIVKELIQVDQISEKEATEIFDREFCNHCAILMRYQYLEKYGALEPNKIDRIPLLYKNNDKSYLLLISSQWSEIVVKARDDYIKRIIQKEKIDLNEAQELFYKNLWGYLIVLLQYYFYSNYANKDFEIIFAKEPYDYINLLSLEKLLDPSSKYYNDFIPIYNIVTQQAH